MTSRELTSGFDFWSRGHLRMAVMHLRVKFGADILIQSGVIDIIPKFIWRPPPSWIYRLCEFGHSDVLTVWYLCSVPNWVKIYALVSEIDARMLQTFILMTLRELTSSFDFWSRDHLCAWPWLESCIRTGTSVIPRYYRGR